MNTPPCRQARCVDVVADDAPALRSRNKVIMMPHFYFPSISQNTNPTLSTAPGYYTRLSNSFGYLNKAVGQLEPGRG